MAEDRSTRRTLLRSGWAAVAAVTAGCLFEDDGPSGEPIESPATDTTASGAGGDGTTAPGTANGGGTERSDRAETETAAETATPSLSDLTVRADRVAWGFTSPVDVVAPLPDRRFVVDQTGQIHLQDAEGVRSDPYLDVSDRIVEPDGYDERGLLGLAFHPDFADNGRFFVRYSAPRRGGTPESYSHTFVLSEFRAAPDDRRADPDTERTVLEIPEPQGNHNAGDIAFGPDGYLYVATGDGGAGDDRGEGHVEDWYGGNPGGNGQDVTENLLGGILRIDVDGSEGDRNYAIPGDNPLVNGDGLDEYFAWGLRNPWRLSFGPDGRLFVADVGQGAREEIDVVETGGNYGWNVKEGTRCFRADECPESTPADVRGGEELIDPVIEYPHGGEPVSGVAVIGGHLYDGSDLPDFRGLYLFADWRADGRLFAARETDEGLWPTATVSVESDEQFGPNVHAFGRDPAGELYVCTTAETGASGDTGAVFRLREP